MITEFADKKSENLFNDKRVRKFQEIERQARRKLQILNAIESVEELRIPPGNKLESLVGDRDGQWSIRINQKWRICFRFKDGNAYEVEIVDYH